MEGPGQLLALIRSRPAWTRRQLREVTGMSRPTLLERLAPLFAAGLVREAGASSSTGGRPARLLCFDDRWLAVLTVDLGHTHVTVSVTDIYGTPVGSRRRGLEVAAVPPAEAVALIESLAAGVLDTVGVSGRPAYGGFRGPVDSARPAGGRVLAGIGFGLPAPVRPGAGAPGATPTLPGWDSYPLRERLAERWPVPAIFENDARALAVGEAAGYPAATVLAVKWASGIGAGLVVDGAALTGEDGAAGDIGHIRVTAGGPRCRCGRRGCLAAHAAGYALLDRLRPAGVATLDDLSARVRRADPVVTGQVSAAARQVGEVLAAMVAMVNPGVLVLAGTIGRLPPVVEAVAARIRGTALHRSTGGLRIEAGRLGEGAVSAGMARLVAGHVLAPDAVDRALSAPSAPSARPADSAPSATAGGTARRRSARAPDR